MSQEKMNSELIKIEKHNVLKTFIYQNNSLIRNIGIAIILFLTALLYIYGIQYLKEKSIEQFSNEAAESKKQIEINFDKYHIVLKGLKAFIITNSDLSPQEFRTYIDSLNIVRNYPGFEALNYAKYYTLDQKEKEVDLLKKQMTEYLSEQPEILEKVITNINNYSNDFGDKNDVFMIAYDEPIEKNYSYIGKNLSNYPAPYKVLKESLETHQINQSGKLIFSKKMNNSTYWALGFRTPVIIDNKYFGSVGAAVDYGDIIRDSMPNSTMLYKVYDIKDGKKVLIFDSNKVDESLENNGKGIEKLTAEIPVDPYIYNTTFKVNEKEFHISFYTKDSSIYLKKSELYFLILICVLFTLLLITIFFVVLNLFNERHKAIGIANDMTNDLQKMAWFDSLTGLYNRAYLLNYLDVLIKKTKGTDLKFTIYFIDLNGFKKVNDILGHQAGDTVLKEYANRLSNQLEKYKNIKISRIGGDEFIVVVENQNNVKDWVDLIKKATINFFEVGSNRFTISQSIGISNYPTDGDNAETLLRKADIAMYSAKTSELEANDYVIYDNALGEEMIEKNKIENHLVDSIKNNELYLVFQPKMKYINNKHILSGFEALIRWNSAVWGNIPLNKFIPIAENNGFIDEISRWLIVEVCKQIKYFEKELNIRVPVSINLSGKQFINSTIAEEFLYLIKQQDIDLSLLLLEITESTIMKQPETAKQIIELYRKNNLKVSLDDFGTGYSSFSYLSQFIVDEIKIDKSFIRNINTKESDKALVEAIILMANKLKLRVVVEGIETKEQLEYLQTIGCDNFQGYYFSKPIPVNEITAFNNKYL